MLVLAGALGIAIAQPAWGATPTEVLETFFGGANAILRSADAERGTEAPRQAIRALVNQIFDYRDAAERALGPAWQSRTPAEQAEFVRLFADFLERGYIAFVGTKANVNGGMQVRYLEESITGDSAAVATALLSRNGSDLDVDYFMARRGGRWMVQDVVIDGMSLIANYRAQFNRILSASPYTELLARMQGETLEVPQPAVAAGAPAAPMEQVAMATQVPPAAQVPPVAQVPQVAPVPTVTQSAAAAAQPAKSESPPAVVEPAVVAQPVAHQEVQLAARSVETLASRVETIRMSAPEPAIPVQTALNGASRVAASHYWIQVGAFRTVGAAVQLAERLRRLGIAASNDPLARLPGHPAGALARVRVGPFATLSDATSKLRELIARGYAPFIAEARD
jgi:phospholipid transport system substrate-binding protein